MQDAVVVLKSAKLEDDRLTFEVQVLEGRLTGADGPASVFIARSIRLSCRGFPGARRGPLRTKPRGIGPVGIRAADAVQPTRAGVHEQRNERRSVVRTAKSSADTVRRGSGAQRGLAIRPAEAVGNLRAYFRWPRAQCANSCDRSARTATCYDAWR